MVEQGISQADLARKIGCRPSALTALFKPETQQSRLVPKIHRVLGWPPPQKASAGKRDEARQRLERIWQELTPEQRELLLGIGAQMKR